MQKLQGRILGIDYGKARIGLAKSDITGVVAQSYGVLKRKNDAQAISEIVEVARDEEIAAIVVGLPKNMDGSLGERALHCQTFAQQVAQESGLPVELYDERLTTVFAERMLLEADVSRRRRRQVIDAVAATVMLQSFLDSQQE